MEVVLGRGRGNLTGPLQDGTCIRQSFTAKASFLESVSILFSTYKRVNPGTILVEVMEGTRPVAKCVFPSPSLIDNSYREFPIGVELVAGTKYELRISTRHCRSGMSPTAHYGFAKDSEYLMIGTRRVNGELACKFKYSEGIKASFVDSFSGNDSELTRFIFSGRPSATIVILNKDRPDLMAKCADSIIQHAPWCDVVIGDTGSTDPETLALYASLPDNFRVVEGLDYDFSKNNNELVKNHVRTSHVLFLNNDVFLEDGCVERMMEYSLCYKFGAVGLRLMKERGVIDHDGQLLWDGSKIRVPDHENVNRPPSMVSDNDTVTQGVTAACVLTRRELFESMGGFDEEYEDVYQDCDYCMKLAKAGFYCMTVRSKSAMHVGSATRGVTTRDNEAANRDRRKYMEAWKYFSLPQEPLFSVVTCCNNPRQYMDMARTLPERNIGVVEMIPVMNHDNVMTVTRALNVGGMAARGKWIIYCHQDVLYSDKWVGKMGMTMGLLEKKGPLGVVGFEGLGKGGVPYTCKSVNPKSPVKVQTLDELCLVTPVRYEFDEQFEYHYYGADFCLEAERRGMTNYLVGIPVKHLSGGTENVLKDIDGFKAAAEALRAKWPEFNFYTTTTRFENGGIYYMMLAEVLNEQD